MAASRMPIAGRHCGAAMLALLSLCAVCGAQAQPAREAERTTYAALDRLPDWSGWWGFAPSQFQGARSRPLPLKQPPPAAGALDPLRYCRPQQFTGSSGGFTEAVEFLFTPGRVTLTNERGLIRRIYTGGQQVPADFDPTNTGLSIGHWEGATLVVETTHINPRARLGGVPIGEKARIMERISLEDPATLRFDIDIVAPDALTEPYRLTQRYTRVAKTVANEITWCTEYDRSIEPGSGQERFDLTPPPDLPPPPSP
jgi:hypothetical protein